MNDQFDALKHAEHARQLQALATAARAAYEQRIVQDGTRLGLERDQAARRAHAAEYEKAAAELQARREVRIANEADRAAAELERKAPNSPSWRADAEELREQAAVQRARAEVARQRAHAADKEADRLEWTIHDNRKTVEALEAQMKSTDRLKQIEDTVDNLEWHARNAQAVAEAQVRLDDLETRIATASERGETAIVANLTQQAVEQRGLITVVSQVRVDGGVTVDPGRLAEIGIDLQQGVLAPPGFLATFPTATDTTTTDAPSADGSATPASTPAPAPRDPTFEDATTGAPAAETTEPATSSSPPTDVDVVTGDVGPAQPAVPAVDDTSTNDLSATPVEAPSSSDPAPAEPAPEVLATPVAVEPEVSMETPQVDIDVDTTPFIEVVDPTIAESEDVLVDTTG